MRILACLALIFMVFVGIDGNAKELAGEIVSTSGLAFIRMDGAGKELPKSPARVKPGDSVYAGDVINTSSEGSVKILMRDKSIVDIGPSTLFKVDEYIHNQGGNRKAKLDLKFGKLRVAVTRKIEKGGRFNVKTKSATMGVRGTEFIVQEEMGALNQKDKKEMAQMDEPSPKQQTQVTVVQGKVEVQTNVPVLSSPKENNKVIPQMTKTVNLTDGTQLTTGEATPSAVIAPVKLNETQLQAVVTEAKVSDNTFVKAIAIEPIAEFDSGGTRAPASLAILPSELPQIDPQSLPRPDIMGLPTMGNPFVSINTVQMRKLTVIIQTN